MITEMKSSILDKVTQKDFPEEVIGLGLCLFPFMLHS